ncbi:hypothetical protein ACIQ6Y_31940 [Streptomyces sp. NPDC096205]|uniref:hypothetical protein n=1 Tax=Streptomyces sp. NPDC096205 TaxID=3366081 RepID=UPI00381480D7
MLLPIAHEKAQLIEVVCITDPVGQSIAEDLTGDEVAVWSGTQLDRALALISDLPGSDLMRCFFPGWGVRVRSTTELLFQMAFCYKCHGVRLWGPQVPSGQVGLHAFDPDSTPARELLRGFREAGSG